jgi:hypothetical protein
MGLPKTELVPCYDCGRAISLTAAACPRCGSREPGGPHDFSSNEWRRPGAEARNDITRIITIVAFGIAGAACGLFSSGTFTGAIAYSLVGFFVRGTIGFAIIVTTPNDRGNSQSAFLTCASRLTELCVKRSGCRSKRLALWLVRLSNRLHRTVT